MRLALAQARRARGRTFPNPPVGAVVYRGARVLGRGFTRPAGGPHAEVVARERAARRYGAGSVRGAALAVTLEPCCHHGRTPPCVDRLVEAGLSRVEVGHRDPHREVSGRGLRRLRRAGSLVQVAILPAGGRAQHRGFLSVCQRGRPFVMLKLASSLDGRIATASGESRWITGREAREQVHRLRAAVDAVMVGSGTALADDPELTARRDGRVVHEPVRVLLDSKLRVPASARLHGGAEGRSWVLCSSRAAAVRRRTLESAGVRLLPTPVRDGRVDLRRALRRLAKEGLTEVLVEGGGDLGAALLRAGLVDELHWFTAPLLLGGDGQPALTGLRVGALAQALRLDDVEVRRIGCDVHLVGRIRQEKGVR